MIEQAKFQRSDATPPACQRRVSIHQDLIDESTANPGVWFTLPARDNQNIKAMHNNIKALYYSRHTPVDVLIRGRVLWVCVKIIAQAAQNVGQTPPCAVVDTIRPPKAFMPDFIVPCFAPGARRAALAKAVLAAKQLFPTDDDDPAVDINDPDMLEALGDV
jgi:hypothetical protein